MRIIHTVESYPARGGIAEYLSGLLPRLAATGNDVSVLAKIQDGKRQIQSGIEVTYLANEIDLVRYIRNVKPDIVHVHDWPAARILKAFQDSSNPKIVIHHHAYNFICPGQDLFWRKQKKVCDIGFGLKCIWNAYSKYCQRSRQPQQVLRDYIQVRKNLRFAQRASLFIANSSHVKEKLVQAGVPRDRVTVLNYFTNISYRPDIKSIHGRILFIGRIAESKGVETLIDAVCRLDKALNWTLVIAGDGYHKARVKAIVAARGIEDKVNFSGWVSGDQKVRLLHEATVVVAPSSWPEAFGIVGIEAMACGRPVVAFDVGGISDWLENEHTGYLIPPFNTCELANKIEYLLRNSAIADKMGGAGREEVNRRFLPEKHLKHLIELYTLN